MYVTETQMRRKVTFFCCVLAVSGQEAPAPALGLAALLSYLYGGEGPANCQEKCQDGEEGAALVSQSSKVRAYSCHNLAETFGAWRTFKIRVEKYRAEKSKSETTISSSEQKTKEVCVCLKFHL